ncbi:MAG: poly-gamma-glutamate system protein, partial [Bdellovibrionota bacterium]
EAAKLNEAALQFLANERVKRGLPVDARVDPARGGMVGLAMSPISSRVGSLPAKRTTRDPNWSAFIVSMLVEAGVKAGDFVAVGMSGSFPAWNVALLAAAEKMGFRPIVISSVASSSWGANDPSFTWLDMERALADAGIFHTRSIFASLGGLEDRAVGLSPDGVNALRASIRRNEVREISTSTLQEGTEIRMRAYRAAIPAGAKIKAYVNIGGNMASTGGSHLKKSFHPGLNLTPPVEVGEGQDWLGQDGVMLRFVRERVPVIHLSGVRALSEQFGIPWDPEHLRSPGVGLTGKPEAVQWLSNSAGSSDLGLGHRILPWFAMAVILFTLAWPRISHTVSRRFG